MIGIGELRDFLPHVGRRAGEFGDPPTGALTTEAGVFDGISFAATVHEPSAVIEGEYRTDLVVANPSTGLVEYLEGPGSDVLPDTSAYRHCGQICRVNVQGRANDQVIIERSDITDLRTTLHRAGSERVSLVQQSIFRVGGTFYRLNGTRFAPANLDASPRCARAGETLPDGWAICRRVSNNVVAANTFLAQGRGRSWVMDFQLTDPKFLGLDASLSLQVQLYGSSLQTGTGESAIHTGGVSWYRLSPADLGSLNAAPYVGHPAFRIEIVASPEDGNTHLMGMTYVRNAAGNLVGVASPNATLFVQLFHQRY